MSTTLFWWQGTNDVVCPHCELSLLEHQRENPRSCWKWSHEEKMRRMPWEELHALMSLLAHYQSMEAHPF